jgi:hypothetical protein
MDLLWLINSQSLLFTTLYHKAGIPTRKPKLGKNLNNRLPFILKVRDGLVMSPSLVSLAMILNQFVALFTKDNLLRLVSLLQTSLADILPPTDSKPMVKNSVKSSI